MSETTARNNGEKTGRVMPPVEYQFKPGNPGRPKGARSRFSEKFVNDFLSDWEKHGAAVIAKVREEKPDVYLRTATAILPKVSDDPDDDFDSLTPEELDARLAELEARTAALLGSQAEAGGTGEAATKPGRVH